MNLQDRVVDQRAACRTNGKATAADINLNWYQSISEAKLARLEGGSPAASRILLQRAHLEAKAALAKTARVDVGLASMITYAEPREALLKNGFSCDRAYPEVPGG